MSSAQPQVQHGALNKDDTHRHDRTISEANNDDTDDLVLSKPHNSATASNYVSRSKKRRFEEVDKLSDLQRN